MTPNSASGGGHEHLSDARHFGLQKPKLDFVPPRRQPRHIELHPKIAFAIADGLSPAIAAGRAQAGAGNLVAFQALEERDQITPAALGDARRPEALVLQHAAA
jgi:hypothetical protein